MKIKKDRYRKSRGGNSQIIELFCGNCQNKLLKYQKDGKGTLIRLYVDRIFELNVVDDVNLTCKRCNNLIGIPMIYKPENRRAFRLLRGSYIKQ